jgi:hypothetical protein
MTWLQESGACPSWCVTAHGAYVDEEDGLHMGEPLGLAPDLSAYLCLSVDPDTGAVDGPRILVGTEEWSAERARTIGAALLALADAAGQVDERALLSRRAADRRRSADPGPAAS